MPDLIKIEKGIPIPVGFPNKRHNKYPWRTMEVGDSFLVTTGANQFTQHGRWSEITGYEYTTRKVEGGFRIWRTK
jgi:hypothetical protein